MLKHPALKMSNVRKDLWLKEATPDDYFAMIDLLKALYAKKIYQESHANKKYIDYDPEVLMADYQKHVDSPKKVVEDGIHSW